MHILVIQDNNKNNEINYNNDDITSTFLRSGRALYSIINMVKYEVIPKHYKHRYLLEDIGMNIMSIDPVHRKLYYIYIYIIYIFIKLSTILCLLILFFLSYIYT